MSALQPITSKEQARSIIRLSKAQEEELIRDTLIALDFLRRDSAEDGKSDEADRYQDLASKYKQVTSAATDICDKADNVVSTSISNDIKTATETDRWLKEFKRNEK